jgi:YaiO family outer membrane protein
MIRLLLISIIAALLALSMNAVADTEDSNYAQANLAISNKDFKLAESILREHLQHQPNDIEARFQLARVLSWQEKWTEAIKLFSKLLDEQPENADILLARANTFEWMGDRKQALRDLESARLLSPDYSEIWRTEILYLSRENTPQASSQATILANEAKQKFPEENWARSVIIKEKKIVKTNSYAVEASYGHDELTNNRDPWQIASLKLFMQTPDKHFAHLQLDKIQRFDLDDRQIGGSYALPFAQSWYFYAGVTYSPTHKVIANNMLDTKISKSFASGLNLHAGVSQAKYTETSSKQLYLTGEYYWSVYRAAYTYRLIDVENAGTGSNQNIQINKYYDSTSFIGALIAKGQDVEYDGTASPTISDVLTLSIFGRHQFQPPWSLTYSFTYHQQGDFYNRNGFVLGLRFDF